MHIANKDNDKSIPFILVGNKIDLTNSRKVSEEEAREWCKRNGELAYFETSAKDGTAVKEVFMTAGTLALRKKGESL